MNIHLKALLTWLGIGIVAVGFGLVREKFMLPVLGELHAHQFGTVLACLSVWMIIWFFDRWAKPSVSQALGIGSLWTLGAMAFEVMFFHFIADRPWESWLRATDLFQGRMLLMFWLTLFLGPCLATKWPR